MSNHGRSGADAPSGLRPFGAEPATQSQAEPLVPNAAIETIARLLASVFVRGLEGCTAAYDYPLLPAKEKARLDGAATAIYDAVVRPRQDALQHILEDQECSGEEKCPHWIAWHNVARAASGIETGGHDRADGRGAEHESPAPKGDARC